MHGRLALAVILIAEAVILVQPGMAASRRYGATIHESRWKVSASRAQCRLSQSIPRYGKVEFSRSIVHGLTFSLHVKRPPLQVTEALLSSVPPHWNHGALQHSIAKVQIKASKIPFSLDSSQAMGIIAELEEGMFPTLIYQDGVAGRDDVSVAVSPLNFRDPLDEFLNCMAALLPQSFASVKKTLLLFKPGGAKLTAEARKKLDRIAEFVDVDKSVHQISISGYADNKGFRTYNKRLGLRRAMAVKKYLLKKGVSDKKIIARSFGENQPLISNRTSKGRAKNRRVLVILER